MVKMEYLKFRVFYEKTILFFKGNLPLFFRNTYRWLLCVYDEYWKLANDECQFCFKPADNRSMP
ncbi:Uncharacterised protein [Klebsiella variicola]|nr:hypothetical protein L421_01206 [Klebsiella variicola]KMI38917.1 hypothetical protein SM87_01163 [Klebsiella pneumoniae]ESN44965.1 hypothetical protein L366_01048 [Klebsiella variicola]EWD84807.1 hypothetical protein P821_00316 [Klebsiella variicola]KMH63222.1 hypothetical protein SM74_00281 [Klebsiella variicola]